MTFLPSSQQMFNAGRIAAIVAMTVVLTGKTVHLHQECSGCCSADRESSTAAPDAKACPFGCTHHHSEKQSPTDDRRNSGHDEHGCAVCSVLAQAPSYAVITGLPAEADIVVDSIRPESVTSVCGALMRPDARGPPARA